MTKEQQAQFQKLCKQQGTKPAAKKTSAGARIADLEAKLEISSGPEEGDVKKTKRKPPKKPSLGRNRGNPAVTHQVWSVKCKESG